MISSKKGMSPLVATVLLIAFAVALGAMIMNLSGPTPEDNISKLCEDVSISTRRPVCYEDDSLIFVIENDGLVKVDSLQLLIDEGGNTVTYDIGNSVMIPGESVDLSQRMLFPSDTATIARLEWV